MSPPKPTVQHALVILLAIISAAGCAAPLTTNAESFANIARTVHERSGQRVLWQRDDDAAEAQERIAALVRNSLTEEDAVQLALLNSHALQAQYETLALVHGEHVTQTTLQNPFVTLLGRFSVNQGPHFGEFNFLQNLLELFLLPWRRDQANIDMERARLEVAQTVLGVIRDVRVAFYRLQAAEQIVQLRRKMIAEVQKASELEDIRSKSRQVDDINLLLGRATYQQLKLELAHNELQVVLLRETLVELVGLEQITHAWEVAAMQTLPGVEVPMGNLEQVALQQRLDLVASQAHTELLSEALNLMKSSAFVGAIVVGGAIAGNGGRVQQAGPTLVLELPVFNRRQGQIESLQAALRQAQHQTKQLRVSALSQVRRARQTVLTSRAVVEPFGDALVPLRRRITEISSRKMLGNNTEVGAWDVVLARQAELQTQCAWVEALRDYWQARAELEYAVGTDLK